METHGKPWKTHGNDGLWQMNFIEFSSGAILGCQVWEYSHMSQLRVTLLGFYIGFGSGWADLGWLGWLRFRCGFILLLLPWVWLWSVRNRILHDIFPWFFTIFIHFHPFSSMFHYVPPCSSIFQLSCDNDPKPPKSGLPCHEWPCARAHRRCWWKPRTPKRCGLTWKNLEVSWNEGPPNHFDRIFHCKPSIFMEPPI